MSKLTTQQKIANARANGQDYTVNLGAGKGSITYHADGNVTVDKPASNTNSSMPSTGYSGTYTTAGESKNNNEAVIRGTFVRKDLGADTTVPADVDVVVDLNTGSTGSTCNTASVDVVVDLNTGNVTSTGSDKNTMPQIGTAAYTDGRLYAEADENGKLVTCMPLHDTVYTNTKDIKDIKDNTYGALFRDNLANDTNNMQDAIPAQVTATSTPAINGKPYMVSDTESQLEQSEKPAIKTIDTMAGIAGVKLPQVTTDAKNTVQDEMATLLKLKTVQTEQKLSQLTDSVDASSTIVGNTSEKSASLNVDLWRNIAGLKTSESDNANETDMHVVAFDTNVKTTRTDAIINVQQASANNANVIAWDTEMIQQHIAKLKAVITDMENASSNLSTIRERVSANWAGNAATTYTTEMSIDLDDFKVFVSNVGVLADALSTVLNIFTDCETSVTASMTALDTQLDTLQSVRA